MVREERFQYQMKNIAEAKTFLIARAAKRVFHRAGNADAPRLREILQREFEAEHIRFKPHSGREIASGVSAQRGGEAEFLCFGNLPVRTKFGLPVTEADCRQLKETLKRQGWPIGIIVSFSSAGVQVQRVEP